MIAILGDIHFSSSKDYFIATCESFLSWFKDWGMNSPENVLILAGDVVQSSINGGIVIDFLERFYTYSRFKEIHIVVGNHDCKITDGMHQLAYEFYRQKANVKIYDKATETIIEGQKVLCLPYYLGLNDKDQTMTECYSNIYRDPSFTNDYDLVVGHFAGPDASFPGSVDCIENLDKINTQKICLGHIHTRAADPNKYIGSVHANSKAENDKTRAAWIGDDWSWDEETLPEFCEFLTVTYPDPLPKSNALVPIYTVLNCASKAVAKDKYGDIYIRKTEVGLSDKTSAKKSEISRSIDSVIEKTPQELFEEFAIAVKNDYSPEVIEECRKALTCN